MPVIQATQEAKAGESLEPRKQGLQWAEIRPLNSSLGNRGRLHLKKKEKKRKTKTEKKIMKYVKEYMERDKLHVIFTF